MAQSEADLIRFVRFCPWHLSRPGPDLDAWVKRNIPHSTGLTERYISRVADADALNARYARTLDAVGRAGFRRRKVVVLAHHLVREGEAAVAWKRDGEADRYSEERDAEALFLRHKTAAVRAADTLGKVFSNASHAARWTAAFAFLRGMEEVPLPPEYQTEGEPVRTGIAWPFQQWRTPPNVAEGEVQSVHHLVALMMRLTAELRDASGGGYHQARHGPFLYPAGVTPPRESGDLLLNGLLYVAVRAAREASGGRSCLDVGAPMPIGGNPHYSVAVAFVEDVTAAAHPRGIGTALAAEAARQRLAKFLRRSRGVICRGWAVDRDR